MHGFTGSPFEMRPLGEGLADRGYTVYAPRLAAHCETSAVLGQSTYPDWVRSADEAFVHLREQVDRIYVCGLSLGGLITLDLASRRGSQIAAVAALAVPLWFARIPELLVSLTRRLGRTPRITIPKWGGSDIADPTMQMRNNLAQGTIGLSIPAVMSLREYADRVRERLPSVRVPVFTAHAPQDHTAPYACMATLVRELGSPAVETFTATRSYHVLPLDYDRDELLDAVARHVAAHTGDLTKPA